MFSMPGIIIVDNEERELNQLREAFFSAGLSCLAIQYINDDPDNVSGLDHIEIPDSSTVRALFIDLNLAESQDLEPTALVSRIAATIKKISPSGPYVLVFWSVHKDEPSEVIKLLEERFSIPLPLAWSSLCKTDFILSGDIEEDKKTTSLLKKQIKDTLGITPLLNSLLMWESRVFKAASDTLNCLYALANPDNGSAYNLEDHKKNLEGLLTTIAYGTLGVNANQMPSVAIEQGMMPVIADRLSQEETFDALDRIWKQSLPKLGTKPRLNKKVVAILNSFFLIDSQDGLSKNSRGAFIRVNKIILQKHTGKPLKRIYEEFLNTAIRNTEELIPEAKKNTILGFLEISAPCDYAQQNIEIKKYILGALIPSDYEKLTSFGGGKLKHGGIYKFPYFYWSNKRYLLLLDFRYQGGPPQDVNLFGKVLFRIREQVFAEIIFDYAQYSSRPGKVSF